MMEKMLRGLKSLFVAGEKAGTSRQRGRQNKIGNMLFGSYYLQAFLFNLAAGVLSFVWTIIEQGGLFSLAGDFNSQQITFAMAANDAVKAGKDVLRRGKSVLLDLTALSVKVLHVRCRLDLYP